MESQTWVTEGAYPLFFAYVLIANLVSFFLFGWDKHCARQAGRRIPERTLLALALLGGTIGAVAGQRAFRHKTQKEPFRTRLGLIVMLHAAGCGVFLGGILWNGIAEALT